MWFFNGGLTEYIYLHGIQDERIWPLTYQRIWFACFKISWNELFACFGVRNSKLFLCLSITLYVRIVVIRIYETNTHHSQNNLGLERTNFNNFRSLLWLHRRHETRRWEFILICYQFPAIHFFFNLHYLALFCNQHY